MNKLTGFIGLGIMGKPMAKCLLKGGCRLMVNDLDSRAVNELVTLGRFQDLYLKLGNNVKLSLQSCQMVVSFKLFYSIRGVFATPSKRAVLLLT